MDVTLDTHTFFWYIVRSENNKLSSKALESIKNAENYGTIFIPIIVMMELLYMIEKKKVDLSFDEVLSKIEASENYVILPLDVDVLKIVGDIKGLECHDRLIVAAAKLTGAPLVSKDMEIRKLGVGVIW
jgi:PIN domain nuclease of toxin-antitoxin system